MNRIETGMTVLGLLATFLLPWPGAQQDIETAAAGQIEAVFATAQSAEQERRCVVPPAAGRSADQREPIAAAGRG